MSRHEHLDGFSKRRAKGPVIRVDRYMDTGCPTKYASYKCIHAVSYKSACDEKMGADSKSTLGIRVLRSFVRM